ncbi:hypothetical protein O1611_g4331 [Lasiodiplodia mahajangana]|uniref:Uncharacterized protein n=1 Tax=Lasiodiplodia mahajangana TaxID=1108764 RepID=A0ACC2JP91_9PEZI|nr:hypothetical protein O1611_g4331 [Lasiodiplodia mahajangana]
MIDDFFSTLLTSPYAIPLEYLKDASKAETVQDAIVFQHNILRAQTMSYDMRVSPEKTNALTRGTEESDAITYSADVTEATVKIHIVQDAASTRILQALLIAILVFSLGSWAITPNTRILPREPTSIASVIALLADGNLFDLLPIECQSSEEKDIESLFSATTFKMGWADPADPETDVGAGGNNVRFSIYGFVKTGEETLTPIRPMPVEEVERNSGVEIETMSPPARQARQGQHRQGAREAERGLGHLLEGQGDHLVVRDAERARPAGLHHRGALRERGQPEIPPREPLLEDVRPVRRASAREAHGPEEIRGTQACRGRGGSSLLK